MEAKPQNSLTEFLQAMPNGIVKALEVLSAAVSLTDDVAVLLIDECARSNRFRAADIVACLRVSDFVVDRNSEWHFEPTARASLLAQLNQQPDLATSAHATLRNFARQADHALAGDTIPTYLTLPVGLAYHTVGARDIIKGLELYAQSYTGRPTGDQWLLGILAGEQQRQRLLPANAIEPPFFQGMTAYREHDWDAAEEHFRRVVRSNEIRYEVAIAAHLLGLILHRQRHRDEEAETLMRRALQIEERLGNLSGQARVMQSLGNLIKRRDPREAERLLRRSLAIQEREGKDLRGQVQVLQSLGILLGPTNRREAESFLRRSLQLEEQLGNLSGQAQVMLNLANLLGTRRLDEAEEFMRLSLEVEEQMGNLMGQVKVLHSWGQLIKTRNPTKAETLLRRSLKISEESKDLYAQAQVLHTLGNLRAPHDLAEAVALLSRSLEIKERFNNTHEQAQVLNSLGNAFRQHQQWEEARTRYERVLGLTSDSRALSTANVGLSYIAEHYKKDIPAAIQHARQAVTLIRRTNRQDLLQKSEARLRELERRYPDHNAPR